jgi:hypothetical protein
MSALAFSESMISTSYYCQGSLTSVLIRNDYLARCQGKTDRQRRFQQIGKIKKINRSTRVMGLPFNY